jgi:methyl-accepting chemotaxis protein
MTTKVESSEGEKLTPRHKIHTEPLTQILDEIDDSIRLANEAAKDARKAAEEARRAGEKAANEAARVAAEAIAKVNDAVQRALQLAELVKQAGMDAANAYQKRISGKQGS